MLCCQILPDSLHCLPPVGGGYYYSEVICSRTRWLLAVSVEETMSIRVLNKYSLRSEISVGDFVLT
jgi:hypothetical protein